MAETVRIVPRQPIEAKRDEFGEGYYTERGTSIVHRDYLNSGGVGWVEVLAPIVWDGTDEAFEAINEALPAPDQFRRDDFGDGHAWIGRRSGIAYLIRGAVPLMCSIQIVGDSFAILPPEVEK